MKKYVSIRGFELYIRLMLVESYARILLRRPQICSTITLVPFTISNVAMMKID